MRESLECVSQSYKQRTVFPLCPQRLAGGNPEKGTILPVIPAVSGNLLVAWQKACLTNSVSPVSPATRWRESLECEAKEMIKEQSLPVSPATRWRESRKRNNTTCHSRGERESLKCVSQSYKQRTVFALCP